MAMTDPIADMLTRIRNANTAGHKTVDIPASKMKKSIAEILKNEGFINSYEVVSDSAQGTIKVELKYGPNREKRRSYLLRLVGGIENVKNWC